MKWKLLLISLMLGFFSVNGMAMSEEQFQALKTECEALTVGHADQLKDEFIYNCMVDITDIQMQNTVRFSDLAVNQPAQSGIDVLPPKVH